MKNIALHIILIVNCITSYAQSIERSVCASAGEEFSTSEITLDWTLGESIIDYSSAEEVMLSQGFQQPDSSESIPFYSLSGKLWTTDSLPANGHLFLYLKTDDDKLWMIDSLIDTNHLFKFNFLSNSEYILLARPLDIQQFYDTYYGQRSIIDLAEIIALQGDIGDIDIRFITHDNNIINRVEIKAYPNPVQNDLTVEWQLETNDQVDIKLYDMLGRQMVSTNVSNKHQTNLLLSGLPQGCYTLNVSSGIINKSIPILKK